MTGVFAEAALLADGWRRNVRIEMASGRIISAVPDTVAGPGDVSHRVIVPALANLHSHAFQRVMAGLTEERGRSTDSFWSWRQQMYRFALAMGPEDVEDVAAMLYAEMLEAGFTRVGEFHYLHHDREGRPYANPAEMATRIAAASARAGIGLTLLPVFYAHSDFKAAPPSTEQRRFISSLDGFARIVEGARSALAGISGSCLGIAPHSLRAVTMAEIKEILPLSVGGPIHIHVAEQVAEVSACNQHHGVGPVRLLLDNASVDQSWCLIHATHMTEDERQDMAKSGAVAGLCPITEANLGDGIFDGVAFRSAGGIFGIGSDSNVSISLSGELRQYEYSQRLGGRMRNAIADPETSTGRTLFDGALSGGHRALAETGGLSQGQWANLLALDTSLVPYLNGDQILDNWIFGDGVKVDSVWSMGRLQVRQGRHVRRQEFEQRFRASMTRLLAA